MMGYGERSQHALLRVSGRVRDADPRVETAAELASKATAGRPGPRRWRAAHRVDYPGRDGQGLAGVVHLGGLAVDLVLQRAFPGRR